MKRRAYQHDVRDRDDDETAGEVSAQVGAHPPRSVHLRAQPIIAQIIIRFFGKKQQFIIQTIGTV